MTGSRQPANDNDPNRHALLERRMLIFAAGVVKKLQVSPNIPVKIVDQLIRSASSIGANYAEACNGVSKLDFRNKIYIAKKEAAETRFWIDLCIEITSDKSWQTLRQEVHELLVILQTITNTLKDRSAK